MIRAYRPWLSSIVGLGTLSCLTALLEVTALTLLVMLAKLTTEGKTSYLADVSWLGRAYEVSASTIFMVGVAVVLSRLAADTAASWLSAKISADYTVHTRNRILGLFVDAAWAAKGSVRAADLQNLLTLYVDRSTIVLTSLALAITAMANVVVLIGSAFFLNAFYAACISGVAVLLSIVLRPLTKWVRRLSQAEMGVNVTYARQVNEAVLLSREIEVFDVGGPIKTLIGNLAQEARRRSFAAFFSQRLTAPIYQSAVMLMVLAALATIVMSKVPQVELLGITVLLLIRVSSYTQSLQSLYQLISSRVIYLEDLAQAADKHQAAALPSRALKAPPVQTFGTAGLGFSYKPEQPVLRDLTFEVRKGELIGVIGPSGAGKSTLIKLLLGLYVPQKGSVVVNGQPLTDFDPRSWYRRVAYVPQEPILASDTVAGNIRFYREQISDAQVEEAAKLACLDDVIAALPQGYATDLRVAGGELSGGQRQRIAIARALVGKPDVLILDEPTSALDPISEQSIRKTIDNLHGTLTTFIIAHRMSLVSGCDKILVFDAGRLVAFDTPQRLATTNAFYERSLKLAQAEAAMAETTPVTPELVVAQR